MKIYEHFASHMAKMAAMPIYGKNTLKIFFSENHLADVNETLYDQSDT